MRVLQYLRERSWLLFFRLVAPTLKIINSPDELVDSAIDRGRSLLFCLWHEVNFIGFYWFRHRNGSAFFEGSAKGDVLARLANYYGIKDFRITDDPKDGQTVRNTIALIKHIRSGGHGTIALDGPNGPYRIAKPGFVQIAKKTGALVIITGIAYSRKLVLKYRWDKYQLPLPFSKVALSVKTMEVPADLTPEQEQDIYNEIVAELNKAMDDAEKLLKNGKKGS